MIGWTAHARSAAPPGRQVHPAGTLASGAGTDRQVQTVWLAVDSGFSFADSAVLRLKRILDRAGLSFAAAANSPKNLGTVPPAIFVPFWSIS